MADWEPESYTITKRRIVGRILRAYPGGDSWHCSVSAVRWGDRKKPSTRELVGLDTATLSGEQNAREWVERMIAEVIADG